MVDLEYFLLGVFWKNGIDEVTHQKLFSAVHSANMMKKLGVKEGREGFKAADAVKPSDWTDPQIMFARILEDVKNA
jgi:predicted HAD superfamily Cof-like phosphohydrolase